MAKKTIFQFHFQKNTIGRQRHWKQVFAPISYLVTTPSTCSMVNAGQPLGSGLSHNVCTCTMDDSVTHIFIHLKSHNTLLAMN